MSLQVLGNLCRAPTSEMTILWSTTHNIQMLSGVLGGHPQSALYVCKCMFNEFGFYCLCILLGFDACNTSDLNQDVLILVVGRGVFFFNLQMSSLSTTRELLILPAQFERLVLQILQRSLCFPQRGSHSQSRFLHGWAWLMNHFWSRFKAHFARWGTLDSPQFLHFGHPITD